MRFLCFHGRGTSAQIFEMQTARMRAELGDHDFVFINGTVASEPDAGAAALADEFFGYLESPDLADSFHELLQGLIDIVQADGPFDGVMGFSEGGVVAAALLAADAREPFAGFRCGVFFSAAPPWDTRHDGNGIAPVRLVNPAHDGVIIRVPTAHIWSEHRANVNVKGSAGETHPPSPLADLWVKAGWHDSSALHTALMGLCDDQLVEVFLHDLGHAVPGSQSEVAFRGALRAVERVLERAKRA